MVPTADLIAKQLALAVGQDRKPLLSDAQVTERAQAIEEEITLTGFPLVLTPWTSVMTTGAYPYPAYKIDDPRYNLDKIGPGDPGQFAINGPAISCGDLIKLGRACLNRQLFLPDRWPKALRDQFLDQQSHLDAVEELCWYTRWRGVRNVLTKVRLISGSDKDVDQGFTSCLVPIFAEIKNRRRESVGVADGWHTSRGTPYGFDDLLGKFPNARTGGALHVACISTHLEPDQAVRTQAEAFLAQHPEIDAIIIWSAHSRDGRENVAMYGAPQIRSQLEILMAPPEREDIQRWFVVRHLGRNSVEGRVLLPSEIADWARHQ